MISKTALHALKAVIALAESSEPFSGSASIAERIGAPQNYLGKLLQTLARENIVYSQKGLGGGFQLARPPEEITLYDIVEPFDHVSRWSGCFMGRDACSADSPCALHHQWSTVRDGYFNMLLKSTLADVLARRKVAA